MMFEKIRIVLRNIKNRRYKSPDDLYRKRSKFGELNEFFKYQVIASDRFRYSPPFLGNPRRAHNEKTLWRESDSLYYEYLDDDRREEAVRRFNFMYDLVKDRIAKDTKILDVGCNTGFFLEQFHQKEYSNLWGLDPQKSAVAYAHEHRPYLNVAEGYFGPSQFDVECDLLVFFGSITRVPYSDRLFDALDRCVNKYILIWVQESMDDFHRDLHVGLAKKGFVCIEKRVVTPDYRPIGLPDTDGPLIRFNEDGDVDKLFHSHFLFRRVEPRA
jgi:SAM-dependent methyltransferase